MDAQVAIMVSITRLIKLIHVPIVDLKGLHLTGQAVPAAYNEKHDHKHPHQPKLEQVRTLDKKTYNEQRVFVRKERQGFGGGFKILEEYRKKKL